MGIVSTAGDALLYRLFRAYNRIVADDPCVPPTDSPAFGEVLTRSKKRTDINDHVARLYTESLLVDPDTVVELGVRGGESTFAFERVARRSDADLVSVDVEDCADATDYNRWHFVQSDDVEFAAEFEDWCTDRDVRPQIDALFVDTSHLYEHTVAEIDGWFPHLSERAVVFLHDTNLTPYYRRRDGSLGLGWDNERGVIRALEEYFDCEFNETEQSVTVLDQFVVEHFTHCNGLTVLRKLPDLVE